MIVLGEGDAGLLVDSVNLFQCTDVGSSSQIQAEVVVPHRIHDLLEGKGGVEGGRRRREKEGETGDITGSTGETALHWLISPW